MALGSICQIHANNNGLPEPSAAEELEFVMRCMNAAMVNKQADYASIDCAMASFRYHPHSVSTQRTLANALKAALVMHVFHDQSVDASYVKAIDRWMITLGIE